MASRSKRDIESYGIAEIRPALQGKSSSTCRRIRPSSPSGSATSWTGINSYFTLSDENNYTIWHFLKTCQEHGWLYKGTDVMPWCVRCGTGLSEQEIATTRVRGADSHLGLRQVPFNGRENESLLVWTTTPWTLTSNVAAAVNPGTIRKQTSRWSTWRRAVSTRCTISAREAMKPASAASSRSEAELSGEDMLGWRYRGPFDELPAEHGIEHRVIPWDQVSATEGTGIVHIAPGAGKEDFALGKAMDLPAVAPLDESGDLPGRLRLADGPERA